MIMAQYGMVILDNLMDKRLREIEQSAQYYLTLDNQTKKNAIEKMRKLGDEYLQYLNIILFEKKNGQYTPYYKYR